MATTLNKIVGFSLQNTVTNAVNSVKQVRQLEQARQESIFQQAVAEGTMSYQAQIDYREEQLRKENELSLKDPVYVAELTASIGKLKKLNRFQMIRTKYTDALNGYIDGKSSIQNYLDVLEDNLSVEQDDGMRQELMKMITDAKNTINTNELNAVKNRALVAEKDRSIPLLDESITDISNRRAKAQLSGNDDEVAMWDATIIAVKNNKATIQIDNSMNELSYQTTKNNIKANDKLNFLTTQVNGADGSTAITYNGVSYPSMKNFWEQQRGQYIASNYLSELKSEIDMENERIAASSKAGQVPLARLKTVNEYYNGLKSMDIFAPYVNLVEKNRLDTITPIADNIATLTANEFEAGKITGADLEKSFKTIESQTGIQLARPATGTEQPLAKSLTQKQPTTSVSETPGTTPMPKIKSDVVPSAPVDTASIIQKNNIAVPPPTTPTAPTTVPTPATQTPQVTPPTPATTTTPPMATQQTAPKVYIVKAGDTLSGIAESQLGNARRAFDLKTEKGETFNDQTSKKLQIGTKLVLPQ